MKRILRTNLALTPAFFLSFFLLQGQLSAQIINPAGDGGFENGATFRQTAGLPTTEQRSTHLYWAPYLPDLPTAAHS